MLKNRWSLKGVARATFALVLLPVLSTRVFGQAEPAPLAVPQIVVSAGKPIQPLTAYRVDAPQQAIQFYDAKGRSLYFGFFPKGSTLVFSPAEAVTANVALAPIPLDKNMPISVPDRCWIEISNQAKGREGVVLDKSGYAVSSYIPANWTLKATRVKEKEGNTYAAPTQLWYDGDHNVIEQGNASKDAPEVVYYRIYRMYSEDGCDLLLTFNPDRELPASAVIPEHPGEIVLSPTADLRERFAATEIARHVKLITGRALPILCAPTQTRNKKLFLGQTFAGEFKDDLAFLKGSDGFAVRSKGDAVFIFGATSRGTLNGIFRFIEKNSDIIWYRPDSTFGTVFTPMKEMTFTQADFRSKPAFRYRTWSGPGGNDYSETYLWQLRNGVGGYYKVRDGNFPVAYYRQKELGRFASVGGNWSELPFAQCPDNEDFYATINGKRVVSKWGQPCFSAPGLFQATLAEAEKRLAEAPEELDFFTYDYSDSWACCECDACMRPIKLPDGSLLTAKSIVPMKDPLFRSTRTFIEGSRLVAALNETHPGLDCFMLAYIYTAAYPAIKPHSNLLVRFAAYDTSSMRFPLSEQTSPTLYAPESWATRYAQWLKEHPEGMGGYDYFFTAIPAMFAEAAATNMQELAKVGAPSFHSQSQPDTARKSIESFGLNSTMWDMNAMDQWLISHLMWDPFQDVAALRADFIRRVYQAAAPEMTEYYRLFGEVWFDRSNKTFVNCHSSATMVYNTFIVKLGLEKPLRDLLVAAEKKATRESSKRHLQQKLVAFDMMGSALGRMSIPLVTEIASEWEDAASPHWNRAFVANTFRDALNFDFEKNISATQTEVRLMCDKEYLYFRIATDFNSSIGESKGEAYPMRDRVELVFRTDVKQHALFAIGSDGATSDLKNWDHRYDSGWRVRVLPLEKGWGAVGRIPLPAIVQEGGKNFVAVFLRVTDEGKDSFFRSDTNKSRTYPVGSPHTFSNYELPE